ncbi:MAG TPA: DivIVA domain-containing protein [Microbacteriaceae bacterium]|nr:DivIVA domain-containing protein [Microbacteriaceae bacterium]
MTNLKNKREAVDIFPLAKKGKRGYDRRQVENYLEEVKTVFYEPTSNHNSKITSKQLREKSFVLKNKGYDPRYVDAALDRLEDLFFERERNLIIETQGRESWDASVNQLLVELLGRLKKPRTARFKKRSFLAHGYRISQVDAALDQIMSVINRAELINVTQIRQVRFHPQRGGYDEAQVDAFLDGVVEYLLSVKR